MNPHPISLLFQQLRRVGRWCGVLAVAGLALLNDASAQNGNTLLTAYPLGSLTTNLTRQGTVDGNSAVDYYVFTVDGSVREVVATVPRGSLSANIEVSLLRDANRDGIEELLVSAGSSISFGEGASVSLWLDPGTNYVKVRRASSGNTGYELTLSQVPHPSSPGINDNSIGTARALSAGTPVSDFVGISDQADYYVFQVAGPVAEVTAAIPRSSLSGNITLSLLRDANQDGIEELLVAAGSSISFGEGASVWLWLDPGLYYVKVAYSGNTAYDLSLSVTPHPESPGNGDNSLSTARPLTAGQPSMDFVGITDVTDYYVFAVTGQVTEVTATVPRSSLSANITLSFVRDLNQDGVEELLLASGSNISFGEGAAVSLWLDPGTYFVKINQGGNTTYLVALSQIPHPESPGNGDNLLANARLFPGPPVTDFVGINDALDIYRIDVISRTTTVSATVPRSSLSANIQLSLMRDANRDGVGEVIVSDSSNIGFGQGAGVSSSLVPGTYWVKVNQSGTGANTTYLLGISPTGQGAASVIVVSSNLAFGSQQAGSSTTLYLTIRNNGTAVLNVTNITYPAGFGGAFSGPIAVNTAQAIPVTFTPPGVGNYGGTVTVVSDANFGVNSVSVAGAGTPVPTRILGLSGDLAFGEVEAGRTGTRTLTLRNTGNSPLTVTSLVYPAGFSGDFSGTIPSGGQQPVTVTFTPDGLGAFGGTVVVNSDATSGSSTASISGNGIPVKARIIGLLGNLAFGGVEALRSATRVLVITNSGEASFLVSSIAYPEGFSGDFSGVIPAGGARSVTVRFSPLFAGGFGGTVNVLSDANGGSGSTEASGIGTPVLSRTLGLIGDLFFGSLPARKSTTRTLVLTNSGEALIVVSNLSYPSGFRGSFAGTIAAGGFATVTVAFAPLIPGEYGGVLKVNSDANGGVDTIAISGTATPAIVNLTAGTFAGLFYEPGVVRVQTSGFFKMTLGTNRSYTASLSIAGKTHPFSGRLSQDGAGTNIIKRTGNSTLTVVWQADGTNLLTGSVSTPGWEAPLEGNRSVYAIAKNAPQAGRYTVLFPGLPDADGLPGGDGFGMVNVNTNGTIQSVWRLSDGTKVTQTAPVALDGRWPFFATPYAGRGSVLGWLRFVAAGNADMNGRVSWIRPPIAASSIYPAGFDMDSETFGNRFRPAVGKTNRVIAITDGLLTLSGGNLGETLMNNFTVGLNNKITNRGPHKLVMTLTNNTGWFAGSLTPVGTKQPIKFRGAIFQRSNAVSFGSGYFLRGDLSGQVRIEPAP